MKTTIIIATIVFSFASTCSAESIKTCDDTFFKAIKTDFDKSYKQYKPFFSTLNCYGDNAIRGDSNAISAIISLYGAGTHNSEYTEWYAETIEKIYLKSPYKLFDVLLQNNKKTIDDIIYYLENPIDGEKEAIRKVARKMSKNSKYRTLTKRLMRN